MLDSFPLKIYLDIPISLGRHFSEGSSGCLSCLFSPNNGGFLSLPGIPLISLLSYLYINSVSLNLLLLLTMNVYMGIK